MTIEEIDRGLRDRIAFGYADVEVYLTEVIKSIYDKLVPIQDYIDSDVREVVNFLDKDIRDAMTGLVSAFGTPEALVSFLINVPEGQEAQTLDLMQTLITMTFERGL